MKRILKIVGILLIVLGIAVGTILYSAFGHTSSILDGSQPAAGVHTVKDGFVSAFLLDTGGGKAALIDAGNDKSGDAILAALKDRKLDASAVSAVFLTHGHPDHTAACKLFPSATVYAMQEDVALIGDACKVGHPVHDGEVVQVDQLSVEAFAVPGHTPGSAVYLARGVLFFGDSAGAGKNGKVVAAVRFFSKDPERNEASLKALASRLEPRAAEVHALAFAHSGTLQGFAPLKAFGADH